jgi:tetratricopeptide (TPR) repeat protein
MQGKRDEADEHARAALRQGQRVHDVNATLAFTCHLVVKHWDDARANEVIETLAKAIEAYPSHHGWRGTLAVTYLEAGRPADALREYEFLAARDVSRIPWNELGAITLCLLAELSAYFDDRPRAAVLYEMLLPAATRFTIVGFGSVFRGSIARPLALLASTLGRDNEAIAHFEFAVQQNARVGAPPFVAQTQYDYARFLLRKAARRDRERAQSLLAEALDTAARLELPALYSKITSLRAEFSPEPSAAS